MASPYRPYRTLEERIGRAVLLPVKLAGAAVALIVAPPLIVISYPFGAVYFFFAAEGSLAQRKKLALGWPVYVVGSILAMNDFLSLGGFDNRTLTRINNKLNRR